MPYLLYLFKVYHHIKILAGETQPVVSVIMSAAFSIRKYGCRILRKLRCIGTIKCNLLAIRKVFFHAQRKQLVCRCPPCFRGCTPFFQLRDALPDAQVYEGIYKCTDVFVDDALSAHLPEYSVFAKVGFLGLLYESVYDGQPGNPHPFQKLG